MPIFRRIDPPRGQAGLVSAGSAEWSTWSPEFCAFLRRWGPYLRQLAEPRLIHLYGLGEYDYTFSLPAPLDPSFEGELRQWARSLYGLRAPKRLVLLTGLLDGRLDGRGLHVLFALLRDVLAELLGDGRYALYAPLRSVGRREKGFPVHADFYLPELLLNVFDQVPANSSGASLFLRFSTLQRLMEGIAGLPPTVPRRIARRFLGPARRDHYEEMYDLLHGGDHAWVDELERAMMPRLLRIKLHSGQGYLIHDRTWLHGREAPTGGVTAHRVHRLVFNTRELQRRAAVVNR